MAIQDCPKCHGKKRIGSASRECDLCDGLGVVEFTAGERFKERMRQKAFDAIKARHHD